MAVTFTNKAANEMKERIEKMINTSTSFMWISTFHSFGLTIIKENYKLLGYEKNFTILDSEDSFGVMIDYDAGVYERSTAEAFAGLFCRICSELLQAVDHSVSVKKLSNGHVKER